MSDELVSEKLKRAIRESGWTRYMLSQACGVTQASLSRFMSGQRSLSLDAVDKLARVLDLQLVEKKTARKRPSRREG